MSDYFIEDGTTEGLDKIESRKMLQNIGVIALSLRDENKIGVAGAKYYSKEWNGGVLFH